MAPESKSFFLGPGFPLRPSRVSGRQPLSHRGRASFSVAGVGVASVDGLIQRRK